MEADKSAVSFDILQFKFCLFSLLLLKCVPDTMLTAEWFTINTSTCKLTDSQLSSIHAYLLRQVLILYNNCTSLITYFLTHQNLNMIIQLTCHCH